MFLKYFYHLILILLAIIVQISIVGPLQGLLHNINIVFIVIIALLFYNKFQYAIFWALLGGFLLDYYSVMPFGLFFLIFFLSLIFIYAMYIKVFSNRSLFSLFLLILSGIFFYNVLSGLLIYIVNYIGHQNISISINQILYSISIQAFIIAVFFIILSLGNFVIRYAKRII